MAIKPKPKSYELQIFTEAEAAINRMEPVEEVLQHLIDDNAPERGKLLPASPMSSKWHAGVDMEKLPAMTDAEEAIFNAMRKKGSYVLVFKRGAKYYLGLGRTPLDTKLVAGMIKKGWLAKSAYNKKEAYFVTSHMIYGWRKRIGLT